MKDWQGVVIAEGLSDPTVINDLAVYRAMITKDGVPVDYDGNLGRWHIYHVRCSREEIDALQPYVLRGWYAHFWNDEKIVVVYNDSQFELVREDESTWDEAREHGRGQGIPEDELDFPTD